jgi:glycosyltransferase involved in cell wall biosynthesis
MPQDGKLASLTVPTFSVIVPTYNRAGLLKEALRSVLAQEFRDFEVIVVDDGSTDDTPAILNSFGKEIRFFKQDNKGAGAARNVGIQNALGDYVAFLDSDDLWFPWTLSTFASVISQYDRPAILSAKLVEFTSSEELVDLKPAIPRVLARSDYYLSHTDGCFTGAGMAVLRRSHLLKTGGFTVKRVNGEDHDLILRMGTTSGFVQILSPVTLGWRRHRGSATRNVGRTVLGMNYLLEQEANGRYPGGRARAHQRRGILASHIRPLTLECLRHGLHKEAWHLYYRTLSWHMRLRRWKYLVGFPIKAFAARY